MSSIATVIYGAKDSNGGVIAADDKKGGGDRVERVIGEKWDTMKLCHVSEDANGIDAIFVRLNN